MIYRFLIAGLCALALSGVAFANLIQATQGGASIPSCSGPTEFTLCAHTMILAADDANVQTSDNGAGIDTSVCAAHCLIVVALAAYTGNGAVPTTMTDNMGNSYTALTATGAGGPYERLYYKIDGTVGAGHKWTTSGGAASSFASLVVTVFTDSAGTPTVYDSASSPSPSSVPYLDAIVTYPTHGLLVTGIEGYVNGVSHTIDLYNIAVTTYSTISDSNASASVGGVWPAMGYIQIIQSAGTVTQRTTRSPDTAGALQVVSFTP